jgi:hypothetical protein
MIESSRYKAFLRLLFGTVVDSRLSAKEMRQLAEELRRGRLADELAYMIENISQHFQLSDSRARLSDEIIHAENIIKAKKLSKSSLVNIILSIDDDLLPPGRTNNSSRQILDYFLAHSTSSQFQKLLDVLEASGDPDPYLRGITETRD